MCANQYLFHSNLLYIFHYLYNNETSVVLDWVCILNNANTLGKAIDQTFPPPANGR